MESNMQNCTVCGSALKSGAIFCPMCGAQTQTKRKREKKYLPSYRPMQKAGKVVGIFFISMLGVFFLLMGLERENILVLIIAGLLLVSSIITIIDLHRRW